MSFLQKKKKEKLAVVGSFADLPRDERSLISGGLNATHKLHSPTHGFPQDNRYACQPDLK